MISDKFYRFIKRNAALRKIIPKKGWRLLGKTALIILSVCAVVGAVYWLLSSSKDSNDESPLTPLVEAGTFLVTGFMLRQLFVMKDINQMEISHAIFEKNTEIREEFNEAKEELDRLVVEINKKVEPPNKLTFEDFKRIYWTPGDDKGRGGYDNIRQVAFHYEYIGQLIYRRRLNFEIVFDTVTFPNELFEAFFQNDYKEINEKYGKQVSVSAEEKNEKTTADDDSKESCADDQWLKFLDTDKTDEVNESPNLMFSESKNSCVDDQWPMTLTLNKPNVEKTCEDEVKKNPSKTFLDNIRSCVDDQWLGIEYLYKTYEVKRKYNKWVKAAQEKPKNEAEQNKRKCKELLKKAKEEWKLVYDRMPQ